MLFSSGWGLADVESDLHLLVSSLQQQQPRSFLHLAAIRIQHRPKPLVTNSIYLPPLRTSMTSPTITLWTPLIGRRVIWQTCLLPRSSNQAISLFFCWEETRIFFVDFHEIFRTIGLEWFDLDSSSFLTRPHLLLSYYSLGNPTTPLHSDPLYRLSHRIQHLLLRHVRSSCNVKRKSKKVLWRWMHTSSNANTCEDTCLSSSSSSRFATRWVIA